MSQWRRYEILLRRKFNDGQPVPDNLIGDTLLELERQFSAVSWETQIIQGSWQHQGERFRDELFRVFVDVDDRPANHEFFRQYKEQLKSRFRQLEIWITTHPVESL
jgi:hypothetical protein